MSIKEWISKSLHQASSIQASLWTLKARHNSEIRALAFNLHPDDSRISNPHWICGYADQTRSKPTDKKARASQNSPSASTAVNQKLVENSKYYNTIDLSIIQWNCRGLPEDHFNPKQAMLRLHNSDIICVNETWTQTQLKGYRSLHTLDPFTNNKVNCSIYVKNGINHNMRILDDTSNTIVLDLPSKQLFIIATYFRPNTVSHNNTQASNIASFIDDTLDLNDTYKILVLGDINRHEGLHRELDLLNITKAPIADTHRNSQASRRHITAALQEIWHLNCEIANVPIEEASYRMSDHALIKFAINTPRKRNNHRIYMPSKMAANSIANDIGRHNWQMIYDQYYTHRRQLKSRVRSNYFNKKADQLNELILKLDSDQSINSIRSEMISKFEDFSKKVCKDMYSTASSEAWGIFKSISNYWKKTKIMHCIKTDNSILTGEEFQREAINHYSKTHQGLIIDSNNPIDTSNMPIIKVDKEILIKYVTRINYRKAFSHDFISGHCFRLCFSNKNKLCKACISRLANLAEIFTQKFWSSKHANMHYDCRILPLNKSNSDQTTITSMRPIIITSYILKYLEQPILDQLSKYANSDNLNSAQVGFLKGYTTNTNHLRIIKDIRTMEHRGLLVFIDFRSAFDSIDRDILLQNLKNREAMTLDNFNLLAFILKNLKVKLGKFSTTTTTCVPQGLASSPLLFNLYLDPLINELQKKVSTLMPMLMTSPA